MDIRLSIKSTLTSTCCRVHGRSCGVARDASQQFRSRERVHQCALGGWRHLLIALFGTLFLTSASLAQLSTTGTITGTVTDASGAVVPEAAVTIFNTATSETKTTSSNAGGAYAVSGLPVGQYTVTVSKQGFQKYVQTNVTVHPTSVVSVNPILTPGQVTTTVQISASMARVETSTPEVSSEVSGAQAGTLPMNGRNFAALGALMPGVTNTSSGVALGGGGDQTANPLSINGMGSTGTLYMIDGIWNTDAAAMINTSITSPPDTIQELRVLQNNYSVQYNLFGANVIMTQTKSGSSTFHGGVYEFLRNDALDARNFFAPSVSPLKQNIFGYYLGGPIYIPRYYNSNREKTFFFWSQDWRYQNMASVLRGAVPTAEMRQGIFPYPITNPQTGQPFPEISPGVYQITPSMIVPDSVALLNASAPPPNNPAGGFLNYLNLNPQINRQRDDMIKVEHNLSPRLRLMAEFFNEHQSLGFPNLGWLNNPLYNIRMDDVTNSKLGQIQLTAMLTPSMVNTVSVATSQYIDYFPIHGIWRRDQVPDFHEILPFSGEGSERLPQVAFAGGWTWIGASQFVPMEHASDLEDTLTDDWSWLRGNHNVQAGGSILFGTKRQTAFAQSNGLWTFSGNFSGDPIADFLLGDATNLQQATSSPRPYPQYPIASPYVQDRWKVTRRLTLTVGLRFLFEPLPHAQRGYLSAFDPARFDPAHAPLVNDDGTITPTPNYDPLNGIILNGLNGVPLNFATAHQYYWAPSVGFAYDLSGDGKTSLRGGYGISYTRNFAQSDCSYQCAANYPRVSTLTLIGPQFPNALAAGSVAPQGAQTMATTRLDDQSAQIQSYSLTLQHEFPGDWLVSLAGAGNIGRHLAGLYDINQPLPDPPFDYNPIINAGTIFPYVFSPYPGYAGINTIQSDLDMYWNALEIEVKHPAGHNLFLSGAYTWQHGLTQKRGQLFFAGLYGNRAQDYYHHGNEYGSSNVNTPQVFNVSAIWNLPWFRNAKGLKGLALGGWKYSDITTIYTGFSLDPGLSVSNQGLAIRPNRVTGVTIQGPKTVNQWFNTAAFEAPAPGYFGNAAPGSIRGPGLVNFDMAFYKDFRISERQKIEFRAELFNIFNHTNFNAVDTTYGDGSFGQLIGAADPRIIEFALRYEF